MTDAETILQAAYRAAAMHSTPEDVRPVVVAVLETLTSFLGDHWTYEELLELADEIEGSNDD